MFFNSWNHKLLDDLVDLKSKYVSLIWMHLKILVQIFISRFIAELAVVRERTDLCQSIVAKKVRVYTVLSFFVFLFHDSKSEKRT